jgi:hypothetical protein
MTTTRLRYPRGVAEGGYAQLASTYMIPLRGGSMLIGAATWDKTTGRNGYWIKPSAAPCLLRLWICSSATTYQVIMKVSGAATNFKSYLSHSTGCYVGKEQFMEFKIPARESEVFNFAINQGKGSASTSAAGLRLDSLIVWEEY